MPEGAQQPWPLALSDDVPGKSLHVQVEGDKVVHVLDLSAGQLVAHLLITGTAGHDLAPSLGWQRVVVRRRGVPTAALRHVADASGDVIGQVERRFKALGFFDLPRVPGGAVTDGGVDVAVWVVPQQTPDASVRPEGHGALLLSGVEQKRDNGVT